MGCPTGTSSPTWAVTLLRTPEAGASISTVVLSVSITMSTSPWVTGWPSAFSHCNSLPVSCAIPSAGMITFVATLISYRGCLAFAAKRFGHLEDGIDGGYGYVFEGG